MTSTGSLSDMTPAEARKIELTLAPPGDALVDVRDVETNRPIEGCQVSLLGLGMLTRLIGAEGREYFPDLEVCGQ